MVGSAARNPREKTVDTVLRRKDVSQMPRRTNSNPRYSRHKASGQAVVTISGKDVYLGPWKSKVSLVAYDRVVSEWLAAGRRLPELISQILSVGELIERYWEHAKSYYRHPDGTTTSELYPIKSALRELNRLHGMTDVSQFGPLSLDAIRTAMIHKG